jgi:hypothetical protein
MSSKKVKDSCFDILLLRYKRTSITKNTIIKINIITARKGKWLDGSPDSIEKRPTFQLKGIGTATTNIKKIFCINVRGV